MITRDEAFLEYVREQFPSLLIRMGNERHCPLNDFELMDFWYVLQDKFPQIADSVEKQFAPLNESRQRFPKPFQGTD